MKGDLPRFLWNFLANATAAAASGVTPFSELLLHRTATQQFGDCFKIPFERCVPLQSLPCTPTTSSAVNITDQSTICCSRHTSEAVQHSTARAQA